MSSMNANNAGISGSAAPRDADRVNALVNVARVELSDEKPSSVARIFPGVFLAVLFGLLLIALVFGVRTYSSVAGRQESANANRESLELIANSVRANDASGSIAAGTGPEGRSLVVIQKLNSGIYEIRTYLYQGKILQEYALQGSPYSPGMATVLAESDTFSYSFSNGLLCLTTDQGACEVALRNMQGGE